MENQENPQKIWANDACGGPPWHLGVSSVNQSRAWDGHIVGELMRAFQAEQELLCQETRWAWWLAACARASVRLRGSTTGPWHRVTHMVAKY